MFLAKVLKSRVALLSYRSHGFLATQSYLQKGLIPPPLKKAHQAYMAKVKW